MKLSKYTISVILIIIAAAVALYLFFPRSTNHVDTTNMAEESEIDLAREAEVAEQNKTSISLANPDGPYVLVAEQSGQSASDLLNKYIQVGYKEYDFGTMVESINGLAADKESFWAFYVNGEFADRGVSQTTLEAGDTIEFIYEATENMKL